MQQHKSVFPVDIGNKICIIRREFWLETKNDVGKLLHLKNFSVALARNVFRVNWITDLYSDVWNPL